MSDPRALHPGGRHPRNPWACLCERGWRYVVVVAPTGYSLGLQSPDPREGGAVCPLPRHEFETPRLGAAVAEAARRNAIMPPERPAPLRLVENRRGP